MFLQLGAFFGAIFAFVCGDKLGRKKTIWVAVAANAIGAALQIASWHLPQMIVGRVINGFGMGKIPTSHAGSPLTTVKQVYRRRPVRSIKPNAPNPEFEANSLSSSRSAILQHSVSPTG